MLTEKVSPQVALRKRLSSLWNVAPYRVDVVVGGGGVTVSLDGRKPSAELMSLFEQDIRDTTSAARAKMN